MQKIILLLVLTVATAIPGTSQFLQDRLTGQMLLETANDNIKGTPYLFEEWRTGTVYMKSGAKTTTFPLKFNSYNDQLIFKYEEQAYIVENNVKEFELAAEGGSLRFRRGLPAVDKNTGDTYYQVLVDGSKAVLLKRYAKILGEAQQYNAAPIKEYTTVEVFYMYIPGGNIVKLKKDKNSLLDAAGDKRAQMESLINRMDTKMNRESDLIRLLNAYNEL
jgi:hypothetical protein